jgi:glycosyltransferase involved in cell wall biosynthesis
VSATKDDLADRLRPLAESAAARERIGRASRAYAEEVHDLERMTDRLLALYAGLR